MSKHKTLRDLQRALQEVNGVMDEITGDALYSNPPELSFEQKIIQASKEMDDGHPLKDFLTESEVMKAINILADVYTVTGVRMPDNFY